MYLFLPGGHPRNWNRLCDAAIKVMEDFISSLNATSQTKSVDMLAAAPTPTSSDAYKSHHPHLRLRNIQQQQSQQSSGSQGGKEVPSKTSTVPWPKPLAMLWAKLSKNSLFSPYPEAAARMVFAKAQLVIWAVEGTVIFTYSFLLPCLQSSLVTSNLDLICCLKCLASNTKYKKLQSSNYLNMSYLLTCFIIKWHLKLGLFLN